MRSRDPSVGKRSSPHAASQRYRATRGIQNHLGRRSAARTNANVPITITALTAETRGQLTSPLLKLLSIFCPRHRGNPRSLDKVSFTWRLATTEDGEHPPVQAGIFPNVAVYLVTIPSCPSHLDIYAADLERTKCLEAQGTLSASGAQAGVIRLHHQQARARQDRAIVMPLGDTSHGDNAALGRDLNLPLI